MLYGYNNGRHTYCKCVCDCGNEKIVSVDYIKKQKYTSCGCQTNYLRSINNRTNELGNKYNRLTIIEIDYSTRPSVAKCVCDCGKEVIVPKAEVISGHTKSCGCLQSERTSKANTKDFSNKCSDSGVKIISRSHKNSRGLWIWNCICPLCGNIFKALPSKVLSNHTSSCGCKIQSSKERAIEKYLKQLNVSYTKEQRFVDCKHKYTLPFDFAVHNNDGSISFLIEYDGEQHFRPVEFYGGAISYKETKRRDEIKTKYCIQNNIKLLRFNYKNTNEQIFETITNTIYP